MFGSRLCRSCLKPGGLALAGACALGAAGCGQGPGAALIPTPSRPATVLPSEVPPVRPDGYANVLADPATVTGLPRDEARNAADEAALTARGRATEAAAARLRGPGFAADLTRRARTHVAETRAVIEAGARPQNGEPPRLSDLPPGAVPQEEGTAPADPGRPAAVSPRAVGVPPFRGGEVAPQDQ